MRLGETRRRHDRVRVRAQLVPALFERVRLRAPRELLARAQVEEVARERALPRRALHDRDDLGRELPAADVAHHPVERLREPALALTVVRKLQSRQTLARIKGAT